MKNPHFKLMVVAGLILILDQLTKLLATQAGLVQLNAGISFSFGVSLPQYVHLLVGVVLLGGIWKLLSDYWFRHPVVGGAFFGAAASNLIDRLLFGGVRDWLIIPGTAISNNLADWVLSLTIGVIAIDAILKVRRNGN